MSEIKFCRDCANLLGRRDRTEDCDKWRCGAPGNQQGVDLVSGLRTYWYGSCKDARMDLVAIPNVGMPASCGIEGRLFEPYQKPDYRGPDVKKRSVADSLLDELNGL